MLNPYQPPETDLSLDASANNRSIKYAGFWARAIATIIDSILWLMVALPSLYLIYGMKYFSAANSSMIAGPADALINWIIPIFVILAFWYYKQATPAKILLKMKIVDAQTGNAPTLTQFIIRYLAYIPSMLVFGLGFLWVAWDQRKQGWHDKLAGTVVVFPQYNLKP